FLLHLVVDPRVQRMQPEVLVAARVQEILVARGQLAAQQEVQVVDDLGMALHGNRLQTGDCGQYARAAARAPDGSDGGSHSQPAATPVSLPCPPGARAAAVRAANPVPRWRPARAGPARSGPRSPGR